MRYVTAMIVGSPNQALLGRSLSGGDVGLNEIDARALLRKVHNSTSTPTQPKNRESVPHVTMGFFLLSLFTLLYKSLTFFTYS